MTQTSRQPEATTPTTSSAVAPFLSDFDLHLLAEGTHYRSWEKLGAHLIDSHDETGQVTSGVHFAVWAPNAGFVSVVGDFNNWETHHTPMRQRGPGIWEVFVPHLGTDALYKYYIEASGRLYSTMKTDPYGFYAEVRPLTASIVYDLAGYTWQDREWLAARPIRQALDQPISIYEVHVGSWRHVPEDGDRPLTYRELADQLIPYAKNMGFTHIELLPVTEHPFDQSWGYQTTGYYAPTSRFGTPHDFMYFVDQCHQNGLGVLLDWVPSHFAKEGHGLGFFDGSHLYEHEDPRQGEHIGWGTFVFNYSHPQVRNFLLSNALFWLEVYHIDGFRIDAVASMLYLDYGREETGWVANQFGGRENLEAIDFLQQMNTLTHMRFPGALTIAEESTAWPRVSRPVSEGGLGFSLKWNMGWMHDTLEYIELDPIHRRYHQGQLTFSFHYWHSENFVLPLSHDEVVHLKKSLLDKMPGDTWQKFANLRAYLGFMFAHPGKKLLFMGGEFGQWGEWGYARSLDWHFLLNAEAGTGEPLHAKLRDYVQEINRLYIQLTALHRHDCHPAGFAWIDGSDEANSVISFIRRGDDPAPGQDDPHTSPPADFLVVIANFTPVPRPGYRVGVPAAGRYSEVLNSDDPRYGGSGVGNPQGIAATSEPRHGYPYSIAVTLPPLGLLLLQCRP